MLSKRINGDRIFIACIESFVYLVPEEIAQYK